MFRDYYMDFQDFIMELCQDYGAIGLPLILMVVFYLYSALKKKEETKQFGIGHGQAAAVTAKSEGGKLPKREAVNDQMSTEEEGSQVESDTKFNRLASNEDYEEDDVDTYGDDEDIDDEDINDEDQDLEHGYGLLTDDGDDIDDGDDEYDENGTIEEDYEDDSYENKAEIKKEESKNDLNQTNVNRREQINKVFVMYLVPSSSKSFLGYELLQALSNYHVHLSEKKHFQRFSNDNGSGQLWYHVASLTNPGTFDMSEPGKLECKGLVFIMESEKIDDLSRAFESMLKTCRGLAEDLKAEVLDDNQQPFSENKAREIRYFIAKRALETCSN